MVTHARNLCSTFNPSKCAHTAVSSEQNTHTHTVNTHQEQWAAINAAAPGEQLWVRCLAQGHLSRGIEGGESAVHSLPPHPTYNPCRSWDSNLRPLGYKSYSLYIRSRLPHLMQCAAMLHFSKSDEETNSSTSWMIWKWAHFQSIFIFGWTGPLMSVSLVLYDHVLYCVLWIYDCSLWVGCIDSADPRMSWTSSLLPRGVTVSHHNSKAAQARHGIALQRAILDEATYATLLLSTSARYVTPMFWPCQVVFNASHSYIRWTRSDMTL